MTFAPKPFEAIYAELVNSTQTRLKEVGTRGEGVDLAVGSVIRTLYESFAYEMALLYEQMDQVYQSAFIDTASGLQLEMVAAILGIQRGLPDYAEGVVTFTRDVGQEDIEIPMGTLVATEDSADVSRKPYTTLEARLFPAGDTEIAVKVQAMERGEDQVVAAHSITVMPLPVAGVKAVRNAEATQFLGKRLETDTELRQRAKNALLASGKASLSAIETALLSLPGVREVKVVEPGPVGTRQSYGVLDIYIDDRDLETMPPSGWLPQSSPLAELSPTVAPGQSDDPLSSTLLPTERQRQLARVATLRQRIDQVRAAGVYVRLHGADLVQLDGLVQIEVVATAAPETVTAAVRTAIATHLARLPLGKPLLFPPLVQAMLAVPGVANMEEFALVPHWPKRPPDSAQAPDSVQTPAPVLSGAKRLDASAQGLLASKFRLGDFRVVGKPQDILVRVAFWVGVSPPAGEQTTPPAGEMLPTSAVEQSVLEALKPWFQTTFQPGTPLAETTLRSQIPASVRSRLQDLRLMPQNPSPLVRREGTTVTPGFAERFVLAEPLAIYDRYLDLVGALRVTAPQQRPPAESEQIQTNLQNRLEQWLDQWPPRQNLSLVDLQQHLQQSLAKGFEVGLNVQDFRAIASEPALDRLDVENRAIRVEPYERLRIGHLLISDRTVPLPVTLTALELTTRWLPDEIPPSLERVEITPNGDTPHEPPSLAFATSARTPENQQRAALETSLMAVLRSTISTFPAQPPGQDFDLATLHQHLANAPDRTVRFRRLDFTITRLDVTATSGDGRSQTARLGMPPTAALQTIHVRSLEQVQAITVQANSDPITLVPTTP